MIKLSENIYKDLVPISRMLMNMYLELYPREASKDPLVYMHEMNRCLADPMQHVYLDADHRGFFIVQDETTPMLPTMKLYNGTRVYVKPKYRNGRVLKEFYDTLFREFPEGDILGLTLVQSEHIKVLEKRHTRIANMYKLNRSK